jgi:hypothetical protein
MTGNVLINLPPEPSNALSTAGFIVAAVFFVVACFMFVVVPAKQSWLIVAPVVGIMVGVVMGVSTHHSTDRPAVVAEGIEQQLGVEILGDPSYPIESLLDGWYNSSNIRVWTGEREVAYKVSIIEKTDTTLDLVVTDGDTAIPRVDEKTTSPATTGGQSTK